MNACEWCGKDFEPRSELAASRHRFHTDACRMRASRFRRRMRPLVRLVLDAQGRRPPRLGDTSVAGWEVLKKIIAEETEQRKIADLAERPRRMVR